MRKHAGTRRQTVWVGDVKPSPGHQIHDRICLRELRIPVVRKGLAYDGPAFKRTVSVYAIARRRAVEGDVPLPRLFQVTRDGNLAFLDLEYMGPDSSKSGVGLTEFRRLRKLAITELQQGLGVMPKSVSRHRNNWSITARPGEGRLRAYLLDFGNVCLRGSPYQREYS